MGQGVSGDVGVLAVLLTGLLALGVPVAGQSQVDTGGLGWTQGREDAPIQVVEFTDPSCPYCARFHEEARDSLFRDFVAPGHALWVTVPWVSGLYPNSEVVAWVLACIDTPEQAEDVLTRLYHSRDRWLRAGRAEALGVALRTGEQAGLGPEELRGCVESGRAERSVSQARVLGRSLGVRGTPTYFVNGFPAMGAVPYGFIRRVFDHELERVSRPGGL